MNEDWTIAEVELIVSDYFNMFQLELEQKNYNKAAHRRSLIPLLNNRSEASIEFKHQNISAVLVKMGLPYIKGYKPRFNYQKSILEQVVANYLEKYKIDFEKKFVQFSDQPVSPKPYKIPGFESFLNAEPISSVVNEGEPLYKPIKTNYIEREQNNRQLGEEGEKLVIEYEKWRLIRAGKENLINDIKWISKELGDGTGYDILSKNSNGTDRFIEVKTTKLPKETPIYLTRTELGFASLKGNDFYLYRVFNFDSKPQLFIKQGRYEGYCKLHPLTFRGYF